MEIERMLNITNLDIESEIKNAINETKDLVDGLTNDRTCKIYSSYIYNILKKKKVLAHIVDTQDDMNMNYSHRFVMVPCSNNRRYIIDLTYSQFGIYQKFMDIYNKGYQVLDNQEYLEYLNNINKVVKNSKAK